MGYVLCFALGFIACGIVMAFSDTMQGLVDRLRAVLVEDAELDASEAPQDNGGPVQK